MKQDWDDHELDQLLADLEPEGRFREEWSRQVWGRIAAEEHGGTVRRVGTGWGIAAAGLLLASVGGAAAGWTQRGGEMDGRQQYLESLSPFHSSHGHE